jgi:hypothetical protein
VCFVDFPGGHRVVVKGVGDEYEVYVSRLAQSLGMPAPNTRIMSTQESERANKAVGRLGKSVPKSSNKMLVMEYVPGVQLEELASSGVQVGPEEAAKLAYSLGQWLAFDLLIRESDRFGLISPAKSNGLNTANMMVNPGNLSAGITGIDQTAVRKTGVQGAINAVHQIIENDALFAFNMGNIAASYCPGKSSLDVEMLGERVIAGAKAGLAKINSTVTPELLQQLKNGLHIGGEQIQAIEDVLAEIKL